MTITAAVLLAVALLAAPRRPAARARTGKGPHSHPVSHRVAADDDPLAAASALDVLALCLAAGMTVPDAAAATARSAPPQLAGVLRRGADLLVLGAQPNIAWSPPADRPAGSGQPQTEALLRLARRSGSSGAALARGVTELATQCRGGASHAAAAAAQRAAVLIAGPLGVCFLPAFVCLGIVPVVAGLAGDLLGEGLL